MPKKVVRSKTGKPLYGAAAKKRAASLAKKRKARKNPSKKTTARRKPAAKKRTATKRRSTAKKTVRKNASSRRKSPAKKKATTRRKTVRRKTTAAKRVRRKNPTRTTAVKKRKSPKHVAAGKKAARTRKRNLKARSNPARRKATRKRKSTTKRRRKNPSARAQYRTMRRRGTNLRKKSRKRPTKRTSRGVKTLRRARRSIKYQRAYGGSAAKKFMRDHKMRSNPNGAMVDAVKTAFAIAVPLYGTRYLSRKILPMVPGLSTLGPKGAPVAGAGLMLGLGAWFTSAKAPVKIGFLRNNRQNILIGMGLNFVNEALTALAPSSWLAAAGIEKSSGEKAMEELQEGAQNGTAGMGEYIGLGNVYDEAMGMGNYIEVGAEEELGLEAEMGEYIGLGLEAEMGEYIGLGLEAEMGGLGGPQYGPSSQIGTGIGSNWGPPGPTGLLKRIPDKAFVRGIHDQSFVRNIPDATKRFDAADNVYTGIFAP